MSTHDGSSIGDRMKEYEAQESDRKFVPLLPVVARLDGRGFSKFTKDMKRPFDMAMSRLMIETARWLARETNSPCAYTQSDEITLCWWEADRRNQIFFDGRIQKLNSVLSGMAAAYFNRILPDYLPPKYAERMPHFDCRTFMMPNMTEVANCYLWRVWDASKNSISMSARCYYEHEELHKKSGKEMQEMIFQKGMNWNDYPSCFKRGTFLQRRTIRRPFSIEELESLPPKHFARQTDNLMIERVEYVEVDMPPFSKVLNREEVIFSGEDPQVENE